MAPRVKKAHGNIIQADWNQTDPLQMDYIHNKPEIFDGDYNNLKNKPTIVKKIDQVDLVEEVYRFGDSMIEISGGRYEQSSTVAYGELCIPVPENTNVTVGFVPGYDPNELGICWATCTEDYMTYNPGAGGWRVEQIAVLGAPDPNGGYDNTMLGYLYYTGDSGSANAYWVTDYESITFNTGSNSQVTIVLGEDNMPVSDVSGFIAKYADVKIKISYGKENQTSTHETILRSDTELYYDTKLTDLTINGLSRSFDRSIAQEWSIAFTAGDADPIVTIPNSASFYVGTLNINDPTTLEDGKETLPIKWLYAEPIFEANKKYLITFKQIIDTIYGVWTVLE